MLVTLCWWPILGIISVFYVGDRFLMLVPSSWCWWRDLSPTSKTCHQLIWSPTSVTNIDVTHFSLVWLDKNQRNYSQWNKIWNDIQHGVSTIHFWTELFCSECWKVREVLEIAQKVIDGCHNDNLWCVFNRRYSSNIFHLDRWIRL